MRNNQKNNPAFLLGPEARYLCGSIVLADGGSEALLRPDHWPASW